MIEFADASSPPLLGVARELFREYQAAIQVDLCFQGFDRELAELPGAYAPPAGHLVVALVDGVAAGCGALRPLDPAVAELSACGSVLRSAAGAGALAGPSPKCCSEQPTT